MSDFQYGGARALTHLHARHLREFLGVFQRAQTVGVILPTTEDPSYASLDHLIAHVLGAAGRYLFWICRNLGWPAPDLPERPSQQDVVADPWALLERILGEWDRCLRALREDQADACSFESTWGVMYSIDAMLEHAVMHPMRHTHQLQRLMAESVPGSRFTD